MVSVLLPTPPLPDPIATMCRTSARLSAILRALGDDLADDVGAAVAGDVVVALHGASGGEVRRRAPRWDSISDGRKPSASRQRQSSISTGETLGTRSQPRLRRCRARRAWPSRLRSARAQTQDLGRRATERNSTRASTRSDRRRWPAPRSRACVLRWTPRTRAQASEREVSSAPAAKELVDRRDDERGVAGRPPADALGHEVGVAGRTAKPAALEEAAAPSSTAGISGDEARRSEDRRLVDERRRGDAARGPAARAGLHREAMDAFASPRLAPSKTPIGSSPRTQPCSCSTRARAHDQRLKSSTVIAGSAQSGTRHASCAATSKAMSSDRQKRYPAMRTGARSEPRVATPVALLASCSERAAPPSRHDADFVQRQIAADARGRPAGRVAWAARPHPPPRARGAGFG